MFTFNCFGNSDHFNQSNNQFSKNLNDQHSFFDNNYFLIMITKYLCSNIFFNHDQEYFLSR